MFVTLTELVHRRHAGRGMAPAGSERQSRSLHDFSNSPPTGYLISIWKSEQTGCSYAKRSPDDKLRKFSSTIRTTMEDLMKRATSRLLKTFASIVLGAGVPTLAVAQVPSFELGTVYQCPAGMSFKVTSCTGTSPSDQCDVQSYANGQPMSQGKSPRQQILTLVPVCHAQTAAEAKAVPSGSGVPNGQTPAAPAGVGGFKIGDTVEIDTAFGWTNAKVLRINGNSYYVHAQTGADVWKTYPNELRRIGPINAEDRAHGMYAMHDRVQVNVQGQWLDGEIITERALEYQVQLTGNRTAWASGPNIRLVTTADKAAPQTPKAGTPPKPGFASCAGKIEGRYSSSAGIGALSITFRSGKATIAGLGEEELECWTAGGKIILHKAGESNDTDMPIDINNDGTLDTPVGEIRKKGN